MRTETIKPLLSELGDVLIDAIKNRSDFFGDFTVVVPSIRTEQWFKAYWLKTQHSVLMNVNFKVIDKALLELINTKKELITKEELKLLVIKTLSTQPVSSLPDIFKNYIYDGTVLNPIKLYDISEKLAQLFAEYDTDMFTDLSYEQDLYNLVQSEANKLSVGTLKNIFDDCGNKCRKKTSTVYFFGFSSFTKIQETILKEYEKSSDIHVLMIEQLDRNTDFNLIKAPSKLREIEAVHGEICRLLENKTTDPEGKTVPENMYSDFLVLAPNISAYETTITRVFNQDDKDFPSIPFVINDRKKIETDVILGIKKLAEIAEKKFYTRLDFSELINNRAVQMARDFSQEEVNNWVESVIKMNVFRQREILDDATGTTTFCDDWDYAKKRVLLSTVSFVNDINDNVVELSGEEYVPFTNIGFEDESIDKFVQLIDDLKSWLELSSTITTIDNTNIIQIRTELDKWFSRMTKDDEEKSYRYKKISKIFDTWDKLGMPENVVPFKTLFYTLYDAGTITHSNTGEFFTSGITFADFDERSVLSAKYVFFLNGGSTQFPPVHIKSELDLRMSPVEEKRVRTESAFRIQKQNTPNFYVSYVAKNLKTDEDYYLSPFIESCGKAILTAENDIPIDESRDWDKLYTKREYKNKDYNDGLLPTATTPSTVSTPITPVYENSKKVTLRDMATFLEEPLKYKAKCLFNRADNTDEQTRNEFEPFYSDNLQFSAILKKMLVADLKGETVDTIDSLNKQHKIPNITTNFNIEAFDSICYGLGDVKDLISYAMGTNYEIVKYDDMKFNTAGNEWILICNNDICRYENDNHLEFIELKKLPSLGKDEPKYDHFFTYIYVAALMDVASRNNSITYDITLRKGIDTKVVRKHRCFSINPQDAKQTLEDIYQLMNDFTESKYFPTKYVKSPVPKYRDFKFDPNSGDSWMYFDNKKMFDLEKQLGYTEANFSTEFINYQLKIAGIKKFT